MNTLDEVIATLKNANTIIVTAHIRPDGDAVGSALGLHRLLLAAGKSSTVVDLGPIPERYQFLVSNGECRAPKDADIAAADCIVALDAGAIDRTPPFVAEWKGKVPVINIDHHKSNTNFGDLNLIDEAASSVGEILCELATTGDFTINSGAAEALWVAIATDTGRFSYSNTSSKTMHAAAELLCTGIDTASINHAIYNAMPLRQLQLQGRALQHLTTHEAGRVAMVTLSRDDYTELGCTPADAEDVVNLPRSLEGVNIAIFLYELLDEPGTKVSLRTSEPYDAAEFCRLFDGGGHARAAGCSLTGSLDVTISTILERVHAHWFSA
jgi:phosphoesterase RecJ-like protein